MTNLLIFGDSITWGAWDEESGGWAQRLRNELDKRTIKGEIYCVTYNLGVSGETTEFLLERLESEIKARVEPGEESILIFAIGANDSQWINKQKKNRCSPQDFNSNIQKIIKTAEKYSKKIIFLGITPIDEKKVDPIPWAMDRSYKDKFRKEFNDLIKSACQDSKVRFIDVFDKLMDSGYKENLLDGVHPNAGGHKKIFKIVKDFLNRNKII